MNAYFVGANPKEKRHIKCNHLSYSQYNLYICADAGKRSSQITSYIYFKSYTLLSSHIFFELYKNEDHGHKSAVKIVAK